MLEFYRWKDPFSGKLILKKFTPGLKSVAAGFMIGSINMAKISPAQFVRQVRQEILRISWASRRETGLATITVFAMATIAAIFFLLVDAVLSNVVQFILGFGS